MAGFKELLEGLARSAQGGGEAPTSGDLTSSILASIGNRSGTGSVGSSIQQAMLSQMQKQIEADFKTYLIGRGVSKDLLDKLSFRDLLQKRKEFSNKSDEELWAGVQDLMVKKGGMNDAVAGMLVGLLQQNVDMGTIKGLLGGTAMSQDMFKAVLSAVGNNPKNARMLADHQECIQLLLGSMSGQPITPDFVMKVVQECQKSKKRGQYETESDGELSDPLWPQAARRRTVGALGPKFQQVRAAEEDDEDEEKDEEEEEEDEEDEDEEEEEEEDEEQEEDEQDEDEEYVTSSQGFESASDDESDEGDEGDESD